MHALTGGIPRGFPNHKSPEGRLYRAYLVAMIARLWPTGEAPAVVRGWLREAGRLSVEIERVAVLHGQAVARRRLKDARQLRRMQTGLGRQLMRVEARLEHLATEAQPTPAQVAARAVLTRVPKAAL